MSRTRRRYDAGSACLTTSRPASSSMRAKRQCRNGVSTDTIAFMVTVDVPDRPTIAVVTTEDGVDVVMSHGDGRVDRHRVRLAGPGVAIRFASGEPGRRGTVWRLWANRNVADVYLASRQTADEFKVSLHASGDWRVQIVQPDQPKSIHLHDLTGDRSGRMLFSWQRPEPEDSGWTYCLSIVLPGHHLLDTPLDRWQDVQWHRPPEVGEHVEFVIYLVTPNRATMTFGTLLRELQAHLAYMDAIELASGEVALVLALSMPTPNDEASYITRAERLGIEATRRGPAFDASTGPRHLVMGSNHSGEPRFYDLAHRLE